jgi:2-aminoadipate transaminase
MLGKVFLDEGDIILTELPTYLAAINAFKQYGPKMIGLQMDQDGIKMDALEKTLKDLKLKGKKPKFLYTVPTCQNPAGITLSLERRKYLLELASDYDFLILEDDPYSFFLYEPIDIKHLKSMDSEGRVIYLSTFSKILSPGMRLGWIAAEESLIEKFVLVKQSMDLCTSRILQYIASEAIKRKIIHENLPKSCELYKNKRDRMLKALETYFPEGCQWTKPIGGLFIFAWLPEKIDAKEMIEDSVKNYGVAYVPGQSFFVDGSGRNSMRLNFTYSSMELIDEGIMRLGKVIRQRVNN